MNANLVSAATALAGALIGGLASLGSSWVTQWVQLREKGRDIRRARHEALYTDFINEASRLFGDALSHEKDDVTDLVLLYAIIARLKLIASPAVVAAAEKTLNAIIETYLAPNRTLHEVRLLASEGGMNVLSDFSEACRIELAMS